MTQINEKEESLVALSSRLQFTFVRLSVKFSVVFDHQRLQMTKISLVSSFASAKYIFLSPNASQRRISVELTVTWAISRSVFIKHLKIVPTDVARLTSLITTTYRTNWRFELSSLKNQPPVIKQFNEQQLRAQKLLKQSKNIDDPKTTKCGVVGFK